MIGKRFCRLTSVRGFVCKAHVAAARLLGLFDTLFRGLTPPGYLMVPLRG